MVEVDGYYEFRRGCASILLKRFQRWVGEVELARDSCAFSIDLEDCVEERVRPPIVASWSARTSSRRTSESERKGESFGSRISMNLEGVSRMVAIWRTQTLSEGSSQVPYNMSCEEMATQMDGMTISLYSRRGKEPWNETKIVTVSAHVLEGHRAKAKVYKYRIRQGQGVAERRGKQGI